MTAAKEGMKKFLRKLWGRIPWHNGLFQFAIAVVISVLFIYVGIKTGGLVSQPSNRRIEDTVNERFDRLEKQLKDHEHASD